ncbi:hypothetical protein CW304_13835 [Bacillus sp. UFRGS-B20]|nr:hypothetical protein CW304_13835 [Bacillus sp. UFRGS-B20]
MLAFFIFGFILIYSLINIFSLETFFCSGFRLGIVFFPILHPDLRSKHPILNFEFFIIFTFY